MTERGCTVGSHDAVAAARDLARASAGIGDLMGGVTPARPPGGDEAFDRTLEVTLAVAGEVRAALADAFGRHESRLVNADPATGDRGPEEAASGPPPEIGSRFSDVSPVPCRWSIMGGDFDALAGLAGVLCGVAEPVDRMLADLGASVAGLCDDHTVARSLVGYQQDSWNLYEFGRTCAAAGDVVRRLAGSLADLECGLEETAGPFLDAGVLHILDPGSAEVRHTSPLSVVKWAPGAARPVSVDRMIVGSWYLLIGDAAIGTRELANEASVAALREFVPAVLAARENADAVRDVAAAELAVAGDALAAILSCYRQDPATG